MVDGALVTARPHSPRTLPAHTPRPHSPPFDVNARGHGVARSRRHLPRAPDRARRRLRVRRRRASAARRAHERRREGV